MRYCRTRSPIPILCVAAWVSCTGAPNQDGGVDPGADVGNDTGLDTGATETGPSDASGLDPEWVSIADGLPSFCSLERANHPERLDQLRVHLAPCAVRDNCTISDPFPGLAPNWLGVDGTFAVGGTDGGDGWTWVFVSPLDGGPPLAAYRGGRSIDRICALGFGAIGGGRFAMATSYSHDGVRGASFFVSSLADAAHIERTFFDDHTDFVGSFVQGLYVTESAVVIWDSGGFFADVSTGALVPVDDASGPPSISDDASVVGNTIVFGAYASPPYIAMGQAGVTGGAAYYHAATGIEVHRPQFDGTDVAWVEYPVGATTFPAELWTGRFVADAAAFVPRHVRSIDVVADPSLGAGMWVVARGTPTDPHRIELYDLVDGRRRTYATPDDIAASHVLFIAADRVIYPHASQLVQFDPRLLPYDP